MPSPNEYRAGRQGSTASTSSITSAMSTSGTSGATTTSSTAPPPRRVRVILFSKLNNSRQRQHLADKNVQSSKVLFESLQAQKRSNDPAAVARRQSLNEQRPPAGFFGQLWNKCVPLPIKLCSSKRSVPYANYINTIQLGSR